MFSVGLYYVLSSYDIKPITIDWFAKKSVEIESVQKEPIKKEPIKEEPVELVETISVSKLSKSPEIIKAVYVTALSAGSKSYIEYLDNLLETTEINAVVIDIKDYSGKVMISTFESLIQKLHDKGIYVIARIVVFEDPILAKARSDLAFLLYFVFF